LFLEGDITLTDAGTLATSAGALTVTSAAAATWSTSAGALTLNGTGGVNLQEGGSTIISISDARALATTNTASVDLDATGAIQVNSSGGALSIGNDNVDQTINIATAGTRTLNIGIGDGTDITTTVVKGTLSVGVDDAGYDVVFYGDTASANMTWDTSVDDLILNGAARIVVPDGQLVLGSTAVGSTAAELNLLDGSAKSTSSITLADADAFIVIDGTTTKQIPASDLATYITAEGAMNSFQLEDDSGDEVTINNANEIKFIGSGITTNWTDTDNGTDGDPYDMTFTVDAAQTGITSLLATDIKIGEDDQTKIDFETADEIHFYAANVEQVYLADNIFGPQSDSDVDLGTTGVRWKDAFVDSLTVTDNVIVSGNLTVNGTTTTVDTATLAVVDPIVHLQTASDGGALGSDTNKDVGIAMQYHTGSAAKQAFLGIDDSDSYKLMFIPDASLSSEVVSGSVGTIKANLEGDVTGNVTGNTSGTAATVTTAAQSNITSLGTLTTLTVDNVIVNGTTIGHTSDTDLLTLTSANLAVAGDIEVSGSVEVATIDFTDGDNSMTIADGGKVTFAAGFDVGSDASGDILYHNGTSYVRLARGSDDEVLTLASGVPSWAAATTGDITGVTAGTGLSGGGTSGGVTLNVDASQAITALTGGDLTIYEDANNADVSLKMGTSATEALTIQVLNGGSNKTAEEVHFSTATASGTADHGKMVFDIDGTDIATIDDGGVNVTSGSLETATIDYTDGDLAMTIADGGGVTFAQSATLADDATITLQDEGQIIFADDTPSTDHSGTGIVVKMTALTGLGVMECVHIDSNGKLNEADADAVTTMPAIGIALEANSSGSDADVKILTQGVVVDASWSFTPGADLFVGTTDDAGAVTATAPSGSGDTVQKIGVALTSTSAFLNFNTTEVLLA
jgi:hypothetical protein